LDEAEVKNFRFAPRKAIETLFERNVKKIYPL